VPALEEARAGDSGIHEAGGPILRDPKAKPFAADDHPPESAITASLEKGGRD